MIAGILQVLRNVIGQTDFSNYRNHMAGFCADGASVNFGKINGIQVKLKDELPWLVGIWCLHNRY